MGEERTGLTREQSERIRSGMTPASDRWVLEGLIDRHGVGAVMCAAQNGLEPANAGVSGTTWTRVLTMLDKSPWKMHNQLSEAMRALGPEIATRRIQTENIPSELKYLTHLSGPKAGQTEAVPAHTSVDPTPVQVFGFEKFKPAQANPVPPTCVTCKFYRPEWEDQECGRYPRFEPTDPENWCGEHQPKA